MFGEKQSLFSTRYKCFQTVKNDLEDYTSYIARVNRQCEKFQPDKCSSYNLKCLIFASGLQSTKDALFRNEILKMLDEEKPSKPVTLDLINAEIQRTLLRQQDIKMIGNTPSITHAVRTQANQSQKQLKKNITKTPPSPCWFCGEMHYARYCLYASHKCSQCGTTGHKEGYCSAKKRGAFKRNKQQKDSSPQQQQQQQQKSVQKQQTHNTLKSTESTAQTRIITDFSQLRRHIAILINGIKTQLQLDTASDCTIISQKIQPIRLSEPPWSNIKLCRLRNKKNKGKIRSPAIRV
ncbi:uncharacterized protein LOC118740007 [Rhagoletis pomonella]|uniref:uncharacterized protein LOC118740007 n=1 Tax=Rhagoletis pomonella TaxID=28610 RepID=UPI0017872048|nr:uncharacterized protein LOC118740007 [Rhagoletis pomonella]